MGLLSALTVNCVETSMRRHPISTLRILETNTLLADPDLAQYSTFVFSMSALEVDVSE